MMNVLLAESVKVGKKQVAGLKDLEDLYRLANTAEGKSPKTVAWYGEMLAAFQRYLVGTGARHCLEDFNIDQVRRYVIFLQNKARFSGHPHTPVQGSMLSPRTVQCHCRALKAFASWLYREGYTSENRLINLKLPKAPVKIIDPLTPAEIKKVMAAAAGSPRLGTRNRAIVVLALDTGLRAGEITGINLGQLNLQTGTVRVMGKGSKERTVPIGAYVRGVLWHYIEEVRPKVAGGSDRLFTTQSGKELTINAVKLLFKRLAQTSGVSRLHAHLCRHTFATSYLLNGGDIFSLRGILGHTTFEMVNHYLHFTSAQITEQHHKYSPMDKLQGKT